MEYQPLKNSIIYGLLKMIIVIELKNHSKRIRSF